MSDQIALVTCGPAEHGISRFGRDLAGAAAEQGFTGTILHEPDPHRLPEAVLGLPPDVRLVHLQANDWLFTDSVRRADGPIRSLAEVLRTRGARLSLTLHDLPHQGVSRELFLRRARTYAAMMNQAVTVIVSSEHERLLIEEAAKALSAIDGPGCAPLDGPAVKVIPLPVPDRPVAISNLSVGIPDLSGRPPVGSAAPTIGILGYLYPGKGHREVLQELSGMAVAVTVAALGRPSDGHQAILPELIDFGRSLGVAFRSTGFLPDDELAVHLRDVSVAVAPAAQISASASINSWIAAGRRPLVRAGRYARELDRAMPGAIALYRPGELRERVEAALEDPSLTRLPAGFIAHPDRHEVAARYLRWLRSTAALSTDPALALPVGPGGRARV